MLILTSLRNVAFLEFADQQFRDQISYIKSYPKFLATPKTLTSGKKFHGQTSSSLRSGKKRPPQVPVRLSKHFTCKLFVTLGYRKIILIRIDKRDFFYL